MSFNEKKPKNAKTLHVETGSSSTAHRRDVFKAEYLTWEEAMERYSPEEWELANNETVIMPKLETHIIISEEELKKLDPIKVDLNYYYKDYKK